ncbi:MAG: hypothetical protein K0S11_948 [Gammaproteobacteria bacterium]|jgi:hypothetical protein|nr:hypothetical protein [Gammaproteobacteria bacterium]
MQDPRMMSATLLLDSCKPMAHKYSLIQFNIKRLKYYLRQLKGRQQGFCSASFS